MNNEYKRSWDSIIEELHDEGHPPMSNLVKHLKSLPVDEDMFPETSMLRLIIRMDSFFGNPSNYEMVISYADGRHGGKPFDLTINKYEICYFGINQEIVKEEITGFQETAERIVNIFHELKNRKLKKRK